MLSISLGALLLILMPDKIFSILCSLLIAWIQVCSQLPTKVDSLEQELAGSAGSEKYELLFALLKEYIYRDPSAAKPFADQMLVEAKALEDEALISKAYNTLGVYYQYTSNYDSAAYFLSIAKRRYEQAGNQQGLSAALNNLANAHRRLGYLNLSLTQHMASLRLKEEMEATPEELAASYHNIGNIQADIGNYAESNQWYRRAIRIYQPEGMTQDYWETYNAIAINLKYLDSVDQALGMIEETVKAFEELNRPNDLAGSLDQIGNIYLKKGAYQTAEPYYKRAQQIAEQHGERSLPGLIYRHLASVYLQTGQLDKAQQFATQALAVSQETGVRQKMILDYRILADIASAQGNYQAAFQRYQQFHTLYDSILSEEKVTALNELNLIYETEKKEQEIILLAEKARREALRSQVLLGGVVALVLLIAVLAYAMRQRQQRNAAEKAKLDADLAHKQKELTGFTLQLAHKNEMLQQVSQEIVELQKDAALKGDIDRINRSIGMHLNNDKNWEQFRQRFEAVHKDFEKNVSQQFPQVTANDLRLMALMKMNLSSKEIASVLNLSPEGIKKARYRLRKKIGLASEIPLDEWVLQL